MMLYPKNVPNIERVLRIALGVVLIAFAIWRGFTVLGLIAATFVIVTGFIGWCPACALVGRKIKRQAPSDS